MSVSDARSPTASVLRQSDRLRGGKAMCHATPQEVNLTYSRRVRGLLRAELENTGDPGAFQIVSACGVCPREPRHRLKERSTVTTRQQSEMNPDESILGTNDLGLVRSNDKSYDSGQYYIYISLTFQGIDVLYGRRSQLHPDFSKLPRQRPPIPTKPRWNLEEKPSP